MGAWTDALVEVEVMKGQALVKMFKGVLTAVIVALIAAFVFLPVVLVVLANVLASPWLQTAFKDQGWAEAILLEGFYLIGLFILYWLGRIGAEVTRAVWEWLP
jgi:uncharacterized protein YqhQ